MSLPRGPDLWPCLGVNSSPDFLPGGPGGVGAICSTAPVFKYFIELLCASVRVRVCVCVRVFIPVCVCVYLLVCLCGCV